MLDHPVEGEANEKAEITSNPSYQICEGGGHDLLLPAINGKDEILLFSTALLLDLNIIALSIGDCQKRLVDCPLNRNTAGQLAKRRFPEKRTLSLGHC